MTGLTPNELAAAKAMRDKKTPWRTIGKTLHRSPHILKRELSACGYDIEPRPSAHYTDEDKQRVYDLYVEKLPGGERRSVALVARMVGIRRKTVRRWVEMLGGSLRPYQKPLDVEIQAVQTGPGQTGWRRMAICSIGRNRTTELTAPGSLYCANLCNHGNCDQEATPEDLAAYKRFRAKRAQEASIIKREAARTEQYWGERKWERR